MSTVAEVIGFTKRKLHRYSRWICEPCIRGRIDRAFIYAGRVLPMALNIDCSECGRVQR